MAKEDQIKTTIELSGEAEYRATCRDINISLREIGSEMKLITAQFADNADSVEALTEKQEVLKRQFDEQAKKAAAAEAALEKMKTGGVDPASEAFRKMQTNLNNTKADMAKTQNEINGIETALNKTTPVYEQFANKAADSDKILEIFASELKLVTAEFSKNANSIEGLTAKQEVLKRQFGEQAKKAADLETALEKMMASGVNPASEAFRKMQINLNNTKADMTKTQSEIDGIEAALNKTTPAYEQFANKAADSDKILGLFRSEMKLVSTEFIKNSNSAEAFKAKLIVLQKIYKEQENKVKSLEKALAAAKYEYGYNSEEAIELGKRLNECKTEFKSTKTQIDNITESLKRSKLSWSNVGEVISKTSSAFATGLKTMGKAVIGVGSVMVTGIGYTVNFADKVKGALNDFEAATGIASATTSGFEEAMLRIYNNNFGEDIEDISAAMATVAQTTGEIDPSKLDELTQNAIMLRDTFGFDIQEQMRAVNMLVDQFGISSQEAYNLISQGAQNGLNKNGDLLDSINEYSVHFQQLGLGAENMFNSFLNGTKAGTFSVDKLGDAVKEFGIRVIDGSEGTIKAFEAIGLDANSTMLAFAEGGAKASKTFLDVTKALFEIEDPIAQNATGVALFGSMWEDLGIEGVKALVNLNGGISLTTDALKSINEVKYDTLSEVTQGFGRVLKTNFVSPIGEEALPALSDFVKELSTGAVAANGDISKMADTFGMALTELVQDFSSILPKIAENTTKIVLGLVNGIISSLPSIAKAAIQMTTELAEGIILSLPILAVAATDIIIALSDGLISVLPMLAIGAMQIIVSLTDGIGEALPQLIPKATEIVVQIVQTLINNIPMLIDAALQLVTGLAEGIITAIPILTAALPTLITSLINGILSAIPKIIQAGIHLFTALITALPQIIAVIVTAIPQIISGILAALTENLPLIIQAGISLLTSLITALPEIIATIIQAIPQIIGGILEALTGNIEQICMAGVQLFVALIENLPTIIIEIVKAVPKIVFGIVQAFTSFDGEMINAGSNLLQGLWKGISGSASWLWEKVSGWASEFVNNIKSFFGIHSPSTVFAEIGGNMGEGIGVGFTNTMNSVESNMTAVMGGAGQLTATEAVKAVNDGIMANVEQLSQAINAIVEKVISGLSAQAQRINQAGQNFDENIALGIVQGIPKITVKIPQIIQSILTILQGFVSQFSAVGGNMVQGIWEGFQNMSGWLENNVRLMMQGIVVAVEDEMDINSPSKVFEGIGEYMAQGLGGGFAREMRHVESSIRRETSKTVPEIHSENRHDTQSVGAPVIEVVQNIYANETSYAQQQREAARQFRMIAREVMA